MAFQEYPKMINGTIVNSVAEEKALTGTSKKTRPAKFHRHPKPEYVPIEYPKIVDGVTVNNAEEEKALG